jgi:predicted MFS family arabinose efflux permease
VTQGHEASRYPRLRYQLVVVTLIRIVINTAHRMVYPFMPALARGLGVEVSALNLAVTARAVIGLSGPLWASLSDRRGRRAGMLVGVGLFTLGMGLVVVWPTYPVLVAGLLLTVLAKIVFDPAMQAYLGERVPYSRRGLAVAITEIGWSGASLIGVPVVGFLIARNGWKAPFVPLAVLGLLGVLAVARSIPGNTAQPPAAAAARRNRFVAVLRQPSAMAILVAGLLISAANESVNIVYGVWLESAFALRVVALGATTLVIGVSELTGEALVGTLVDRAGKRGSLIGGLLLSAVTCLALPLFAFDLTWALVGLFFFYLTFEFTIVAALPLMSELVPEARATAMSANTAMHSAGRVLGTLIGPALFPLGFVWNGVAAMACNLIAAVLVFAVVRETRVDG